MTIHDFDTLAASLSAEELSEQTQRRHLALLTGLLTDTGNGTISSTPNGVDVRIDSATDRVPPTESITELRARPLERDTTDTDTDTDLNSDTATDAATEAQTTGTVLRPKFSRGRRTALIAGSVVVLAGAGIGTAAAFGAFSEPTDRSMSHCYTEADLDAAHNDFVLATDSGDHGDAAAFAQETCGRDWANGRLRLGASQIDEPDESGRTYPVPDLAVCVLGSGQVGVFPGGEDTCHQLGLPIADL